MSQSPPQQHRIRFSLKWQVIAFVSLLILVVAGILSWYFLRQSSFTLTGQFEAKAQLLAETLAHNCESALLFQEDKTPETLEAELTVLIDPILKERSVLRVMIADKNGTVIADKSRARTKSKHHGGEQLAAEHALSLATNVVAESINYHKEGADDTIHIAVPVLLESSSDSEKNNEKPEGQLGNVQIIFSLAATKADIRKSLLTGAGLALVTIGIGIVMAFIFGQRALAPIQKMADAASKIAAGDLSQRVQTNRHDEIGVLANAFNHMAGSLGQMTHGLEEKVAARTEELQRVNQELQRATQHKSDFVANMSHELRTPLNAVIGFSEVLREQMFGPLNAKQEEYVTDILTSGQHLLSLINDILDLSKVEAGKMELELGIFDLRKLLENSLVMVKERALSHGIQLSCEIGDDIGRIRADERRVKQVVFNLLSNAVKFTPDKGRVGIRARRVNDSVEISVFDTGVGISKEDMPKLFGEFQQLHTGLTNKPEGTGLGLSLTKRFIEIQGGRIWVESVEGKGSTFTFSLPAKPIPGELTLPSVQESVVRSSPIAARSDGATPKILVIEDDPKAADILRIYLSEAGYHVELAVDGAEGLKKVKELSPDAVILDVLLPNVDGWDFLNQLKADPATRNVPVIIASVMDQKGKGFAMGASDYLVKPVHKDEMIQKLSALNLNGPSRPRKILAIDDDPKNLELLGASLEAEGFQVLKANGGEEGIELAHKEKPDLIILDLLMPGTNGFEVLERLQSSAQTNAMPVVLFTVKQLTPEEKQRLKGRIDAIAPKTFFDREKLVNTVNQVLKRGAQGGKQT
jgi:signal transduction histidine kinase/DNA-binding response OmpR family regulator